MLDALTDKLGAALTKLSGRGRISDSNVRDAMAEIHQALLEADVNLDVVNSLAKRLGADHPSLSMSSETLVDATLKASKGVSLADAALRGWIDCGSKFEEAHFCVLAARINGNFPLAVHSGGISRF